MGVPGSVFGGEAEGFHSFDQNLFRVEQLRDFGDEVGEGHGSLVGGAVHQSVWT
jgi:hypothetical protein